MPQSAIDAQNAYVARVGSRFVNGDAVLNALIQALGGNRIDAETGDAGIPTVGVPWYDPSTGAIIGGGPGGGPGVPGGGSLPGAPGTRGHGRAFWILRRNAHLFGGGVEGGGQPLGVPAALLAARRAAHVGPTCDTLPQPMPLMTVFPSPPLAAPESAVGAAAPIASSGGDNVGTSPILFWGAILGGAALVYYASQKKR